MGTELVGRLVEPFDLNRIELCEDRLSDIGRQVSEANRVAVENAKKRLSMRISSTALNSLNAYFAAPTVHLWATDRQYLSDCNTLGLLEQLCSRVHSVALGAKARGLQIGILSYDGAIAPAGLGVRLEPDSDIYFLSPNALWAAAAANASVEIRLFDRQFPSWTGFADDVAAVTGADVFTKLFIAGGSKSVNGWHRDTSDVLVTVLDGSKRFQVGTVDSPDDDPTSEIDIILRPGDALLLPRSRLHNATPMGGVSALLSIGIMRYGDWSYRGASPTHLGLTNPRSPLHYRLALRPHTPPYWKAIDAKSVCRTRIPGGLGVIEHSNGWVKFVAAGQAFEATEDTMHLLAMIHGADGITTAQLSVNSDRSELWCIAVANDLGKLGLIWQ